MIDPSEPKWNQDQHHAIDTIIQVAFVRIREIIVTDDEWLIGLWKRLARHYHTDTTAPRGNTHIKDLFLFLSPEYVKHITHCMFRHSSQQGCYLSSYTKRCPI